MSVEQYKQERLVMIIKIEFNFFFLFYTENKAQHFIQIVSEADKLNIIIFPEK